MNASHDANAQQHNTPALTDAQWEEIADAKLEWERSRSGPSEGFGDFEAGYVAALAAAPREDEGLREVLLALENVLSAPKAGASAKGLADVICSALGLVRSALTASPAAPREDEGLREALKSLADWVEYGLDLSDEYSLEGAADELVNCRRSVRVWVDGQERLDVARARLAASPVASREDEGEGDAC